jgi:hypothetical protein
VPKLAFSTFGKWLPALKTIFFILINGGIFQIQIHMSPEEPTGKFYKLRAII